MGHVPEMLAGDERFVERRVRRVGT
ncbi:MAG: hypothetical protein QOF87_4298, partial [Pseudonocardiales bacterium]|nr:hypothetical protein [Pseudonocardiales bacterium]